MEAQGGPLGRTVGHHCWEGKSTKESAGFPQITSPPNIKAAQPVGVWLLKSHRQQWDFMNFQPHCPPLSSVWLVLWKQDDGITGDVPTFLKNTGHFPSPDGDLKSEESATEVKK